MLCGVVLLGYEDVLVPQLGVVLLQYALVQLAPQQYALAQLLEPLGVELQLVEQPNVVVPLA